MFAFLGRPELRHVSTWEKSSEVERTAQRQAWGLAADRIIYQLMKIADRIAKDEDDEEDHDYALEVAGAALETMTAAGPWRGADPSSIRVRRAVARLRRLAGKAGFNRLRYAHRLASLVGWRHVGERHATLSTKSVWDSFVNNAAYRKAKRWWPYLHKRIEEGRFKDCRDEQATMELLEELEKTWRRIAPDERRIRDLNREGLDALLKPYRRDDLTADEVIELVAILQARGRDEDVVLRCREAAKSPDLTLTALAPLWPSLPRLVREEALRMLQCVPVGLRPRLEACLLHLWNYGGRGLAWLRVRQAVKFHYVNAADIEVLHHSTAGAVFRIPKGSRTAAAGRLLGHDLPWCTARGDTNWFDHYIAEGPLIVLVTADGRRAQMQLETVQLVDYDNSRVRFWALAEYYQPLIDAWGARYSADFRLEVPRMNHLRRMLECHPGQMITLAVLVKAGLLRRPSPALSQHWLESLHFDARTAMTALEGFAAFAQVGIEIPDHVVRRAVMALIDTGRGTRDEVMNALDAMRKAGIDVDRALNGSFAGIMAARLWGWPCAKLAGSLLQPMAYLRRLVFKEVEPSSKGSA